MKNKIKVLSIKSCPHHVPFCLDLCLFQKIVEGFLNLGTAETWTESFLSWGGQSYACGILRQGTPLASTRQTPAATPVRVVTINSISKHRQVRTGSHHSLKDNSLPSYFSQRWKGFQQVGSGTRIRAPYSSFEDPFRGAVQRWLRDGHCHVLFIAVRVYKGTDSTENT